MPAVNDVQDAIVIGGGFYGCAIAIYLVKRCGFKKIHLIECESDLLIRASFNNQARIHNGYHYPRSFTTAYRSRINFPRFVQDWPKAVKQDFTNLYAIARRNSKVTAKQFERFCKDIGARFQPAATELRHLFESKLIENVYSVEEYSFDTTKLADWAKRELYDCGVQLHFNSCVNSITKINSQILSIQLDSKQNEKSSIESKYIFNCTYSGLNQIKGDFTGTHTSIKHEITELALINPPPLLKGIGITVMDGPFFSIMPFPARKLHTLSHVRYTPHLNWYDSPGIDPYRKLDEYNKISRYDRMIRDVVRYLPAAADSIHIDSLFEIKSVLVKNESDDGRPILFEKHPKLSRCFSILGSKIDNIYDVLEKLDNEFL
jgi:glycine/D-amino acid oxidase-like deaminating enzyme